MIETTADATPNPFAPYANRQIGSPIFPVFGKINGGNSVTKSILGFSLVGLIFLLILKKDLVTELPPFILPNTGNMGLPICLFAYGAKGFGVASAVAAIIMLLHFTVGVFLAK